MNSGWLDDYPDSEMCIEVPGISDHCLVVVSIVPDYPVLMITLFS